MNEVRKFKRVTPTSATMPPILPFLEHLPRLTLTRPPVPIKWGYAVGSDTAMAARCLDDGLGVLLHVNDKKKIQLKIDHFESQGYRVEYIDSDNKDEMMVRGLANKRLPDADLYLCTSVFNDGISVHEHADRYVVILSLESLRHLGPNELVQVAQRLRDDKPVFVYLMRSSDEFDDNIVFLWDDFIRGYIAKVERAEKVAASMTTLYHEIKQTQSSETLNSWETHQSTWQDILPLPEDAHITLNQEKEVYEVNHLAIGQQMYSELQKACHKSRYMMEYWLGLHGFEFDGIIKVEEETQLEKDLITTKKNYSKADRKIQRDTIVNFDSYEDALEASKADIPKTYSKAAKLLPFSEFAKGREEEDREELRLEHRQALREVVKEAEIKQKAAEIYIEHVQTLCAAGVKFQNAVVQAKTDLALSTLTREALDILKYKSRCEELARDSRNPNIAKVDDIAVVSEVLEYMRDQLGKPLDREATNAVIDHALRHSRAPQGLRSRLTVAPRFPRSKPTSQVPIPQLIRHALMLAKRQKRQKMTQDALAEEQRILSLMSREELNEHIEKADKEVRDSAIKKANKAQWQKRKEFLNHFFEIKRDKIEVDGKRINVWIPERELH